MHRALVHRTYFRVKSRVLHRVQFPAECPPAEALLLTDEYVAQQIEEKLTDEKYNEILVLDVEGKDKERFEQAEERRKNPPVIMPTLTEQKGKGRGKKKSRF